MVWREDIKAWQIQPDALGQRSLPLKEGTFQIGRSEDCELVLPHSEELCQTTSRWHCYLTEESGRWTVTDGSLAAVPETGKPKPSISGTFLNERRVWQSAPLVAGDLLRLGPWDFRVEVTKERPVNIDGLLQKIGKETPLVISPGDQGTRAGYESLEELFSRLHGIKDIDDCLSAILGFAMEKIPSAEVAAVLTFDPEGMPSVRLAWQRGAGRLFDFRFSSGLLKALPSDHAFLLKSEIQDATKSQMDQRISSGLLVPLRGLDGRLGVLYMDNRNRGASFQESDLYLANALANVAALQLALDRQSYLMRVEQNMSQYFGPDVVRLIVDQSRKGKPVSLGVRECEATVFFVDIKDFSAFCRGRQPSEISDLLNPYFEMAAEAIQSHGGHVDKFLGDGVMGVFGSAPIDDPRATVADHAGEAVSAGLQLIERWQKWTAARWGSGNPLRIGINTGRIVLGNIGYPGRIEYSALGDAVNLASRLERMALPNGIAVSEATHGRVRSRFTCVESGEEEIRGFGLTKVWRIAGIVPAS